MCEEEETPLDIVYEIVRKERLTDWAIDRINTLIELLKDRDQSITLQNERVQELINSKGDLENKLRNIRGEIEELTRGINRLIKL